jgi:hypothetical protein
MKGYRTVHRRVVAVIANFRAETVGRVAAWSTKSSVCTGTPWRIDERSMCRKLPCCWPRNNGRWHLTPLSPDACRVASRTRCEVVTRGS